MKKIFLHLALFLSFVTCCAQTADYSVAGIPSELKENANAVVRLRQRDVKIGSRKSVVTISKNVVTVFNELGISHAGATKYFDNSTRIKSIEAIILNADGKEIKKIKRKDFLESSVSQGLISDGRVLYLNFTPTEYPFTIIFQSETESSNTAFLREWDAIEHPNESVEKSIVTVSSLPSLGLKYKEFNTKGNTNIIKQDISNGVSFSATNLSAVKNEEYSPEMTSFIPQVLFGLENFNLEGVDGNASTWKDFGTWMYSNLLNGTDEISIETQAKIKSLVGTEKDPVKIAKIVYQYVQRKTRYISIQLGIGGWKPMLAKDVDRLGYGDCKALTNYMRALLKVVGIPSYYTVVYGDTQRRDILQDFVSMQGNHVILALPVNGKMYWLECTNQNTPFAFQGKFTDNRLALLVKPEGGEIVRTHEYVANENTQITKGNLILDESGNFSGSVFIKSKGTQYDNKVGNSKKSTVDLNKFYKQYFSHINNLKLNKINFSDDREEVEFSEEVALEASQYANKSGDRLIFALNAFNPYSSVPARYRTRMNPFEISRGFYDYDEITIDLPQGFAIEAKPENFELKDKFGDYKTEYVILNENQILYKRTYQMNSGFFDKSEYESFRKFREQIAKSDNAKIVLVKKL